MKEQAVVVGTCVAHVDRDRVAAVCARRFDAALSVQSSANTEGVPRTVGVPPAVVREHPMRGRHG